MNRMSSVTTPNPSNDLNRRNHKFWFMNVLFLVVVSFAIQATVFLIWFLNGIDLAMFALKITASHDAVRGCPHKYMVLIESSQFFDY